MKTLDQWFAEYEVSHQNSTNKSIHYVCVPLIYFSIVGLFYSIPSEIIANTFKLNAPLIENWAFLILLCILIFYFNFSYKMGFKIALFSFLCLLLNYVIGLQFHLWIVSLIIFTLAWIGQFYGHQIEGKKPSFLKDLQFLMIGPAWVIESILNKK